MHELVVDFAGLRTLASGIGTVIDEIERLPEEERQRGQENLRSQAKVALETLLRLHR